MAMTDEELESFARLGLKTAEDAFWEFGQSPNAVVLFNEAGNMTFVEYCGPEDRNKVRVVAMLHSAVAGVLLGESWFRIMSHEEEAVREPGYLGDDPKAREQVFALAVRTGDERGFIAAKEIIRSDGGGLRLESLDEQWQDGLTDSWLREALEQVFTPMGDTARSAYSEWNRERAEKLVKRAWGQD